MAVGHTSSWGVQMVDIIAPVAAWIAAVAAALLLARTLHG
jgi:hypothetical protein